MERHKTVRKQCCTRSIIFRIPPIMLAILVLMILGLQNAQNLQWMTHTKNLRKDQIPYMQLESYEEKHQWRWDAYHHLNLLSGPVRHNAQAVTAQSSDSRVDMHTDCGPPSTQYKPIVYHNLVAKSTRRSSGPLSIVTHEHATMTSGGG